MGHPSKTPDEHLDLIIPLLFVRKAKTLHGGVAGDSAGGRDCQCIPAMIRPWSESELGNLLPLMSAYPPPPSCAWLSYDTAETMPGIVETIPGNA
jgi:hypothetical protein